MSTHDRQDHQEPADAPQDISHGMSRDEEEAMDQALAAETEADAASASASDADAGSLSTTGGTE